MDRYCAFTVVFRLRFAPYWTKFVPLTGTRKSHTKERFAIWSGQIPRTLNRGLSPQGAGWLFGAKVTHEFMHMNNLELICRAHQLVHEGYKYMFDDKLVLVTVWSAPNYCYRCGNIASILAFTDAHNREAKLFHAVPDAERVIPPHTTTPYFL